MVNKEYERWTAQKLDDDVLREELASIKGQESEINERFWKNLEFGTAGLRGILGAGINRMNIYTIRRATQGLALYLLKSFENPSICIAYDTRHKSRDFAFEAAYVLCANGIKTYIFEDVRPTPMLSFAVKHKKASGGIVVTASHNPKDYNGYKVYGPHAGQLTDKAAGEVLSYINNLDIFTGYKTLSRGEAEKSGFLEIMGEEVDAPYYEKVKNLILRKELVEKHAASLKIIYSPIHGSGNIPVRRVLSELGFSGVTVVPQQELPDGDFPTVTYPNPENADVYDIAVKMAEEIAPDLIFATDPDCDRIGMLVKDNGGKYSVLSGNQAGLLLCDYIIRTLTETGQMPENPAVISTVVSSDLVDDICNAGGVKVFRTLTGFKYIGELIDKWESDKSHSFIFGYEESYGYLSGDFVRDKDGIIAAVLAAEMTLYYKSMGISLFTALEELYKRYGYTYEKNISITMPGIEGQEQIAKISANLRENYSAVFKDLGLTCFEDYKASLKTGLLTGAVQKILLPQSNVLKFIFSDKSWLVFRPSGTEPKMKIYISAVGQSHDEVMAKLKKLEEVCAGAVKI